MPRGLANFGIGTLAHVEHEIEPCGEGALGLGHAHLQLAAEQSVATVHRLVRKIELGGEHALLRRLHLDVIVAGAAGIERRQDGAQAVAALGIGEQVSAIAKAGVVVLAALVGMPEGSRSACATGRQERVRTCPLSSTRRAVLPSSTNSARSGELGLKYGPSVCRTVGSSPSWHCGVGASGCANASSNPKPAAASAPSTRRRVG